MTTSALDIVKQIYKKYAEKDIDGMVSLVSNDVRWACHMPSQHNPIAGEYYGQDGVRECLKKDFSSVSNSAITPKEFFTSNGSEHVTVIGEGTYIVNETNNIYIGTWIHYFNIVNGKVKRLEMYANVKNIGQRLQ